MIEPPSVVQYRSAVAHPAICFHDPELRARLPHLDGQGRPELRVGNRAVVFRLTRVGAPDIAVRCYWRTPPPSAAARYARLSGARPARPPEIGWLRWIEPGIQMGGTAWPVVVTPWSRGLPLDEAVAAALHDPGRLRRMALRWAALVRRLERHRFAHGDLQHGNILVDEELRFRLVDLDRVWAPDLSGLPPAGETPHPEYLVPGFDGWNETMDRAPALIIYLSLQAVAAEPAMWPLFHRGDGSNLLFGEEDLVSPGRTPLWWRLSRSPDPLVVELSGRLLRACTGSTPLADLRLPRPSRILHLRRARRHW